MRYSDRISQRITGRHKKSFNFVRNVENKIILDIGCSYGWFEKWAIRSRSKKIIGMEINENNFKLVKDKISEADFIKSSVLDIPFRDNFFHVVVMWEVLEHLPKKSEEKAFKEILRVLKSDGILYLSTPNETFWSCVLDPAWWLMGHRHYSANNLQIMLKKIGFEILETDYRGGFFELISMILLYIFKWVFGKEIPFKKWFDSKRDDEYLNKTGFATIFLKCLKMDSRKIKKL